MLLHGHCIYKLNESVLWFAIFYSLSHLILFYNTDTPSHYKRKLNKEKRLHDSSNDSSNDITDESALNSSGEFKLDVSKRRPLRRQ